MGKYLDDLEKELAKLPEFKDGKEVSKEETKKDFEKYRKLCEEAGEKETIGPHLSMYGEFTDIAEANKFADRMGAILRKREKDES